jgi:hypothetical protein
MQASLEISSKATIWIGAAALLVSCGTEAPRERLGTPSVAKFAMTADDESKALKIDGSEVENLPNPLECERVEAWITDSGEARGTCEIASGMKLPIRRFSDMGLFNCVVNKEETAAECFDAYLDKAFEADMAGRIKEMKEKALERIAAHIGRDEALEQSAAGTGEDAGEQAEGSDDQAVAAEDTPADATAEAEAVCTANDVRQAYADQLNSLLAAAGVDLVYEPAEADEGYFGFWQPKTEVGERTKKFIERVAAAGRVLQTWGARNAWCETEEKSKRPAKDQYISLSQDKGWVDEAGEASQSSAQDEGWGESQQSEEEQLKAAQERFMRIWDDSRGYCWAPGEQDDSPWGRLASGSVPTCRCARMTQKIVEMMTCDVPDNCEPGKWRSALQIEAAAAQRWLNLLAAKRQLVCQGSPLVLDLNDDGLSLTSVAEGVTFDLSGQNTVQTAWVSGSDDALLALDRNGNGLIDDGTELFGEAETLIGVSSPHGFAALSVLDDPVVGGNNDGMVDAKDARFGELRLWTDANGDGTSQAGELRSLADAGVSALPLQCIHSGSEIDAHGNDLRMRGSFVRDDGTQGTLIDVYFVTGSK